MKLAKTIFVKFRKNFKIAILILIISLTNSVSAITDKKTNKFYSETWFFSTKMDNFGEYDLSHDPDDKSSLIRFINYQNEEIKHLEEITTNNLSSKGLTYKIKRKFNNLGVIAIEVFKNKIDINELNLPNHIIAKKNTDNSVSYILNKKSQNISPIYYTESTKDHYSNDSLNFKELYPTLGKNINIFVLDTGIRHTHKEFSGRQITLHKKQFQDFDDNGHGSHVAGIISGNNTGFALNSHLLISKILDRNGSGSDLSLYSSLNWIIEKCSKIKGRCIVSMSFGNSKSELHNKLINSMDRLGILAVSAAGNESEDACDSSPAGAPGSLTVASADISTLRLSSFSNYGSCVNIIADGENIISAWYDKDDSYSSISGTSMATPHVSGVAALVWGENPKMSNQELKWYLVSLSKSWIFGYPFLAI